MTEKKDNEEAKKPLLKKEKVIENPVIEKEIAYTLRATEAKKVLIKLIPDVIKVMGNLRRVTYSESEKNDVHVKDLWNWVQEEIKMYDFSDAEDAEEDYSYGE